ncbi:MAG: hypothetical protein AABZ39_01075 [Spirochaetota bacterium]
MLRSILFLVFTAGAFGAALSIGPRDRGSLQCDNKDDGSVAAVDDGIIIKRGEKGFDRYMTRAYKDIDIKSGSRYLFSMSVNVEGSGSARAFFYLAGADGKWDEKGMIYGTPVRKTAGYASSKVVIPVPAGRTRMRICISATEAHVTATFKDVRLDELGSNDDIILTPRIDSVTLDGKLDDALWKGAVRFGPFRVLGDVGKESALKSEAYAALKDGYLYIAYRIEEPDTAGIKATKTDAIGIYADDCTETFISVDQVSYAHILVNAYGAKHWDQRNIGKPSITWYPSAAANFSGDWDAKAAIGAKEWTCEIRVRVKDIFERIVGGEQKIFINTTRHNPRGKEEHTTWAPLAGATYHVPKEFLPLTLSLPAADATTAPAGVAGVFTKRLTVPELLLAGVPVKMIRIAGVFALPGGGSISENGISVDGGIKKMLKEAMTVDGGPKAVFMFSVGDIADASLSAGERAKLAVPEAFKLELAPAKVTINGRTPEGVLRGIATLILMANRARCTAERSLPAMTLYDAPRMGFRGWLIHDSKPVDVIKRTIDTMFLLRLNKAFISLDSFGSPTTFPFDSYPIGDKGRTKEEWVEVFNYARVRGIEPIPYFASWGRVQYLRHAPDMVKYFVDDIDVRQKGYRNLDIANPDTHKIMFDLQDEIIETLKPDGFNIAMDETHYGNKVTSAAARAKGWKPSDWFVEALTLNDTYLKKKNVKMYIWGDMIDTDYNGKHMDMSGPELIKRLPKDMVILDWKYEGAFDFAADFPSFKMFKDAGFTTIGCPWFRPMNIARIANSIAKYKADGMCLTSWNTTRIDAMRPELIRAAALTAFLSWSPENCDLGALPFVPDAVMQGASYWENRNAAGKTRSLSASDGLIDGEGLMTLMGLPSTTGSGFLETAFTNYRGVSVKPFSKNGEPAAVAVTGGGAAVSFRNGDFAQGTAEWGRDIRNPSDAIVAESGAMKISRASANAFLRSSQDVRLDEKKVYIIRYSARTEGSGNAKVWTYSGDKNMKWDETKIIYSSAKGTASVKEIALPAGFAAVRICLSVDGTGTTAWFDDITLVEKGAKASSASQKITIPVNAGARVITFLHAASRQIIAEDMAGMATKFGGIVPGEYRIVYDDRSSEKITLAYRVNVVAANDTALGRECDVGLFGTLGGRAFVNIPTYTWVNPAPEKKIAAIEVMPGTSSDMALLVFGIAVE